VERTQPRLLAGDPKEATYYELYDRAARAIKRVSPRLRVGGPATAQAAWVDRFLAHCKEKNVPVDFASTHVYGNDKAEDVFGTHENIPRTQMVCRAVKKVHEQIAASAFPNVPLIWSEFNASYMNEPAVTDTAFMGPWMADTIRQCDGLTEMMSYWTFSDVFEEQGVVKTPFYGGFGLLAERSIPKPAFNDFALLHRLGDTRLEANSDSVIVTRRKDGSLAIAVWNLFLPEEAGSPKTVTLHFKELSGTPSARVTIVDMEHGSPLPAWEKMGRPAFPRLRRLRRFAKPPRYPLLKRRRSRTAPSRSRSSLKPWHSSRSADSPQPARSQQLIKLHRYCLWNPARAIPFFAASFFMNCSQTKPVRAFSAISSVIPRSIPITSGLYQFFSGLRTSTKLYFRQAPFAYFSRIVRRTRSVSAGKKGKEPPAAQGTMLPSIGPIGAARPMPRIHEPSPKP